LRDACVGLPFVAGAGGTSSPIRRPVCPGLVVPFRQSPPSPSATPLGCPPRLYRGNGRGQPKFLTHPCTGPAAERGRHSRKFMDWPWIPSPRLSYLGQLSGPSWPSFRSSANAPTAR